MTHGVELHDRLLQFKSLTFEDLTQLPYLSTVFVFPMGALEDHGPHLPMGLKLETAKAHSAWLVQELIKKDENFTYVMMPEFGAAIDGPVSSFGTFVRAHVVRDYFVDQIKALNRLGFIHFIIVSATHSPRTLVALDEVSTKFSKKYNVISTAGAIHSRNEAINSPMIEVCSEHGGVGDTSMALLLLPDQVKDTYKDLPAIPAPKASASHTLNYWRKKVSSYWGDAPAKATPALAADQFKEMWESKVDTVLTVLKEGRGKKYFRTPYRFFPLNWTFFPAYVMALLFIVISVFWIFMGFYASFNDV